MKTKKELKEIIADLTAQLQRKNKEIAELKKKLNLPTLPVAA